MSKFILTENDKKYLRECGYLDEDFPQIRVAFGKTDYSIRYIDTNERKKISGSKAIELLGREMFLSGLGRSAFHWSAVRETPYGDLVQFSSNRLFR